MEQRVQMLVVGSGAGGAITAATLAERGYDVLVAEEGPDVDTRTIRSNSVDAILQLYRNGGLTPVLGPQSIAYVEGRCVGGSTEVNSGFWHRLPEECYVRWGADALIDGFDPATVEPLFEEIERELSVSVLGGRAEPTSSALFRRGVERLGWRYDEIPRCQRDPTVSPFAPGAKQSMHRTYLPRAARAGARIVAGCRVRRLRIAGDRVGGADVTWHANGRAVDGTIRADGVFVCGGTIQTAALLRRSGIRRNVGNTLRIHPMLKAAALFADEVDAADGALPVYQVKEFAPAITLGGSVFTPGFLAMILAENWAANHGAMRDWSRMALYYAATRAMSRGTVRALPGRDGDVVARYRLTDADRRNLSVGLARLGELLFATGAKVVYPALRGVPALRSVGECRAFLRDPIPAAAMSLSAVHAFSSCPMGENPDLCATDSFGKVRGLGNLYVNDASLLPDSPGANPQAPTMAIALRNARHFVEAAGTRHVLVPRSRATRPAPAILVTGAPGWLGTRLLEYLAGGEDGGEPTRVLRCLVHPSADPAPLTALGERVQLAPGDLGDPEALGAFCADAEGATLFHVAGVVHPARWVREFDQVNVHGTARLLDAARAARVKRVVVMSSNSPLGLNPHRQHVFDEASPYRPYMGYGRSKAAMERLVHAARARGDLETVVIRSPWFYGPHQPARQSLFFTMIKEGRFPILGDGTQRRSMAYVDNICQGMTLAAWTAAANGGTYWVADERPYPINEIVDTVADVLRELGIGASPRRLRVPAVVGDVARLCDRGLQAVGLYHQKIHVLGEMNATIACSIERARRELGYEPRIALRAGMVASVRWCLENGQRI